MPRVRRLARVPEMAYRTDAESREKLPTKSKDEGNYVRHNVDRRADSSWRKCKLPDANYRLVNRASACSTRIALFCELHRFDVTAAFDVSEV